MSEVIVVVVLIAEILTILQCLQIAFVQELKFDKYMAGIIVADVLLYSAITFEFLPKICSVLFYVLVFVYCYFKFKQKMAKTVISFIIGLSLVGCMEAMAACIFNLLLDIIDIDIILFLSCFVAFIFSYIIRKLIPIIKENRAVKGKMWIVGCIIFYAVAYGVLIVDYYLNQTFIKVYAIFVLTFLILIALYFYKLMQAKNEIDIKNHEIELQRIYGGMYEDLLGEIRRKQHDYKNQLGAIRSIHMVAESSFELKQMQSEYIEKLEENSKYDSILTGCNNPILAGYLYYRCLLCEKANILVDISLSVNQVECNIPLHQIVEIIGILIDNACENVLSETVENRKISINILEREENIKMIISNPARYMSFLDIDNMFKEGFSTKGKDRGLGLTRCLELLKKYNSEINVKNAVIEDDNWIEFTVTLLK